MSAPKRTLWEELKLIWTIPEPSHAEDQSTKEPMSVPGLNRPPRKSQYALGCGVSLILCALVIFFLVKYKYEFINRAAIEQQSEDSWVVYMHGEKDWINTGIYAYKGDYLQVEPDHHIVVYTGSGYSEIVPMGKSKLIDVEGNGTIYVKESEELRYLYGPDIKVKIVRVHRRK